MSDFIYVQASLASSKAARSDVFGKVADTAIRRVTEFTASGVVPSKLSIVEVVRQQVPRCRAACTRAHYLPRRCQFLGRYLHL
jgi:hypothetical protein